MDAGRPCAPSVSSGSEPRRSGCSAGSITRRSTASSPITPSPKATSAPAASGRSTASWASAAAERPRRWPMRCAARNRHRLFYRGRWLRISPMLADGVPGVGLNQDGTYYFDLHHTPDDTSTRSTRSAQQNVAAWTAMLAVLSGGIEAAETPAAALNLGSFRRHDSVCSTLALSLAPLLLVTACNVTKDQANDSTTISLDQNRLRTVPTRHSTKRPRRPRSPRTRSKMPCRSSKIARPRSRNAPGALSIRRKGSTSTSSRRGNKAEPAKQ